MQTFPNIGVDVAKDAVVVACAAQSFSTHSVTNQRTPWLAWLKSLPAGSRIGLESTGGYHELLADLATRKAMLYSCSIRWIPSTMPALWVTAPKQTGWMPNSSPVSSLKNIRAYALTHPLQPTSASWIT